MGDFFMCTCIMIKTKNTYFGRNMDLDYSFNEKVIITPRNYEIKFKKEASIKEHFSIFGVGTVIDNYPLYAEGINEIGLAFAALNFDGYASYNEVIEDKLNLAPYELILYLLGTCKNIIDVKEKIKNLNIINLDFNINTLVTPLHFMVSDTNSSIVIESTIDGLKVYDNPYNILTNNPEFSFHKNNLKQYINLSVDDPSNEFDKKLDLSLYSFGQGSFGLPGDYTSCSRFIRALFIKNNMVLGNYEVDNINQFFYCLDSVLMVKGLVKTKKGFEYTRYQTCYDLNNLVIYYKTYEDRNINTLKFDDFDLSNEKLILVKMYKKD